MAGEFKPNIYPIMYWALAYGLAAGFLLFLVYLLSRYITLFWFPVFAAGLIWGGFRNYKKQKKAWAQQTGAPVTAGTPMQEFREAVSDVVQASREMAAEQRAEEVAAIAQVEAEATEEVPPSQPSPEATAGTAQGETNLPPAPPIPPRV